MVQWTEKPAAKPRVSEQKQDDTQVVYRPVRRTRKNFLVGSLQVLSVCSFFGLIVAAFFMFKETSARASAEARRAGPDRDLTTGRIVVMDHQAECRELGFDNRSGRTVQKGQVSCQDNPAQNGSTTQTLYRPPTNRLESIRRSFAQ